jgi:hypothetical protein
MTSARTTSNKKSKVTTENKEEARLLLSIWKSKEHESQDVFGEIYKIGNQSAVSQFLRGEAPLSLKAAKGFAKGLGCRISDFSPRLAELATSWPFELMDRETYEALNPSMQHKAQVRMDDILKELLQEQLAKQAATTSPTKPQDTPIPGIAGQVLAKKLTAESKDFQSGRHKV